MINVAPIRAAAAAAPGRAVLIGKDQLDQLLAEVETGQAAKRELRLLTAVGEMLPGHHEGPRA